MPSSGWCGTDVRAPGSEADLAWLDAKALAVLLAEALHALQAAAGHTGARQPGRLRAKGAALLRCHGIAAAAVLLELLAARAVALAHGEKLVRAALRASAGAGATHEVHRLGDASFNPCGLRHGRQLLLQLLTAT